ncbi:MAG: hypothetical protein AAB668_00805 [Patescibacteria group bacterium]
MEEVDFVLYDDRSQTEPLNLMLVSALAKDKSRLYKTVLTILEREDIVDIVSLMGLFIFSELC